MMESRGISLRKKRSVRPKISAPQQISAPINGSLPAPPDRSKLADGNRSNSSLSVPGGPSTPPSRSQEGSPARSPSRENTADYVKRRYSRRVPQLPTLDLNDAPAVPSLPGGIPASPPPRDARRLSTKVTNKVFVDVKALQNPNLEANGYVAQVLANASDQEIRDYQADLSRYRNRNSSDLQHNVYQNREQFIKISQEAEKLKGEMRALRNLMSDLTSTLGQTNAALGIETDATSTRKYANRSSVANLEAMWSTHLQELWRRVEGSQKYLPAIPGRHVIHESGRWVELNTATWKPRRRVHLILLNDHLLVAVEKKRGENPAQGADNQKLKPTAPAGQLIADRCWPLQDVEIADLATNVGTVPQPRQGGRPNTSTAINVRIGTESFTCAATDPEGKEKNAFLAKYKKSVTDLRKVLHIDTEEKPASRTNQRRPLSSRGVTANGVSETTAADRSSMTVDLDGKPVKFAEVEKDVDMLDVTIGLQQFEDAVNIVETLRRIAKCNKGNYVIQDLVDGRVQDRAGKLAHALIRQMQETSSFLTVTKEFVTWLTKLGFEVRASEAFLDARSNIIKQRTSQCTDQGDLNQYLYQLSFIYFTAIQHTIAVYQGCFSPAMSSACIKWAKDCVDAFNVVLSQQLSKLDAGSDEQRQCLEKAREHAGMLSEVGVDFRNLVGEGLEES